MMKKVVFVVMMLAMLAMSTCVFADAAVPDTITFTAFVSNPDGAKYYSDYDTTVLVGTLEFGSTIKVTSYSQEKDMVWFGLENDNSHGLYCMKYDDMTIEDLSKYYLGENKEGMAVGTVRMYVRPTLNDKDHAEEIDIIPNGTIITAQGHYNYEPDEEYHPIMVWYYTTYEGQSGWISADNFATKSDTTYITSKDISITVGDKQVSIPMYTELNDVYETRDFEGNAREYFMYDGVVIGCNWNDLAWKIEEPSKYYTYELVFEGVDLYEQASLNSKVLVADMPVGTKLNCTYYASPMALVSYGETKGWIYTTRLPNSLEDAHLREDRTIENVKNDYFEILEEDKLKETEEITGYEIEAEEESDEPEVIINPKVTIDTVTLSDDTTQTKPISPVGIIVICFLAAAFCGLVAIILILLFNKKN